MEHKIVFPRRGVFVRRLSRRNEIVADPTRILFLNRRQAYRVSHPVAGGDDCTAISFDDKALLDFLRPHRTDDASNYAFSSADFPSSAQAVLTMQRLRQYLRRDGPDPLVIEEFCVALLTATRSPSAPVATAQRATTQQFHYELIQRVRSILAQRFREKLTLEDLARASFSSPFHLARLFRAYTGSSLHTHQMRLRLRHSLDAIVEGESNLTQLALDLGFSSHAHFTHAFRREFQISPSQLRRKASTALLRELNTN